MGNYRKGFLYGLMIAAIIAVVAGLFAALFMQLWNWLIPILFNGPMLTYWQAFGLLLLGKLIFGGFGQTKRHWHKHHNWKGHWQDRCSNMSDEDREKWKSHFMNKWDCVQNKESTTESTTENSSSTSD